MANDLMRICPTRGCPKVATGRYCDTHAREHDKQRGTKAERGYGADFQAVRRAWSKAVALGTVNCGRCDLPIKADETWHLDHSDTDRDDLMLARPAHPGCNTSAGGRAAHR